MSTQNNINHVGLVLDGSGSMAMHRASVIRVADTLMSHLAQRSKEMDQETRVSVYVFDHEVKCVIFDKDVLRLPSIKTLYSIGGTTALIDATIQSQADLSQTAQMYGDHAFLTYVLTDGQENASKRYTPTDLKILLDNQAENWTVGVFVPNASGVFEAKRFGFPAGNIATWDTTSNMGIEEVGKVIRQSTDAYMAARATGVRGTRTLFSTGADAVNKTSVAAAKLTPLATGSYFLVPVPKDTPIKEFVESAQGVGTFQVGKTFYPLMKPETIQANKKLAVVEKATAKVFMGDGVRQMIGLPDMEVRVRPNHNPDYTIYVQSTSVNRKLIAGTKVLIQP